MDVKPLKIKDRQQTEGICHRSLLLPKGPCRAILVGSSGSGKTFFACALLPQMLHEPFSIYIFSKSLEQANYQPLIQYAQKHEIPLVCEQELTEEHLNEMMADPMPKYVLYDDLCLSDKNLDLLRIVFKRGRHRQIYPCAISQGYTEIDKQIRGNASIFVLFKMSNTNLARSTLQAMSSFVDREKLEMAYKFICAPENKYSCIFVNINGGKSCIIKPTLKGDEYKLIDLETMNYFKLSRKSKQSDSEEEEEEAFQKA